MQTYNVLAAPAARQQHAKRFTCAQSSALLPEHPRAHDQLPAGGRNFLLWCEILMESHAAAMLQAQPAASSGTGHYGFLNRAAAGAGIIRTDRESLAELERKLMEARQQFQDLKEEKCSLVSSKGCGCGCCPHEYVQDPKATSMGPDSRSVSETSNLPVKRSGRQRSNANIPGAPPPRQRRSLRINGIPPTNILDV